MEANRHNPITTTYYLLVKKRQREGKKDVIDPNSSLTIRKTLNAALKRSIDISASPIHNEKNSISKKTVENRSLGESMKTAGKNKHPPNKEKKENGKIIGKVRKVIIVILVKICKAVIIKIKFKRKLKI